MLTITYRRAINSPASSAGQLMPVEGVGYSHRATTVTLIYIYIYRWVETPASSAGQLMPVEGVGYSHRATTVTLG